MKRGRCDTVARKRPSHVHQRHDFSTPLAPIGAAFPLREVEEVQRAACPSLYLLQASAPLPRTPGSPFAPTWKNEGCMTPSAPLAMPCALRLDTLSSTRASTHKSSRPPRPPSPPLVLVLLVRCLPSPPYQANGPTYSSRPNQLL